VKLKVSFCRLEPFEIFAKGALEVDLNIKFKFCHFQGLIIFEVSMVFLVFIFEIILKNFNFLLYFALVLDGNIILVV
jgi:hypothetical protein